MVTFFAFFVSSQAFSKDSKPLRVMLASSLVPLFEDLSFDFGQVQIIPGSSSVLAKQLANGYKADFFVSADRDWMNKLQTQGQVENPAELFCDRLVLVTSTAGSEDTKEIKEFLDQAMAKKFDFKVLGRIAIGEPETVPVGKLALELIQGKSKDRMPALVYGQSAQGVLRMVEMHAVPFGIVFQSQTYKSAKAKNVLSFNDSEDPVVCYEMAKVKKKETPGECINCKPFETYMTGSKVLELAVQRGMFKR
jgi:molybdate transport system substrate-binding protein